MSASRSVHRWAETPGKCMAVRSELHWQLEAGAGDNDQFVSASPQFLVLTDPLSDGHISKISHSSCRSPSDCLLSLL